ncbi:receptor-interacting protein [Trifolium repens]|nr:receptor-interacting protein [Trifolium repens]
MRMLQGMKDQSSKCDSTIKSLRDSTSSKQAKARLFSNTAFENNSAFKGTNSDKLKSAEESLRTVIQTQTNLIAQRKVKVNRREVKCSAGENKSERRTFLTLEEAGLVEMSGLSTHERFLCRLTISSLNLLKVISEQEGCTIEELNAGKVCDWFLKDKLKREQNIDSAVLQWDDSDFQF